MFQALSTSWAAALAIAVPFVLLFWWARRHAPLSADQIDYIVGRRTQPAAESAGQAAPPAALAPHGAVDAPVPANPAALAPAAKPAVPPASTVTLPAHAPLPPEPASVAVAAPALAPTQPVSPPAPAAVAMAPAEPVAALAAPAPVVTKTPEPVPATEPSAPAVPTSPAPEPVAAATTPAAAPVRPEAAPATTAAAEPPGAPDDFTRLYGPDAAAIAALQAAGLHTYRDLAAANVDKLRQILADAGQPATDPATWPQQARFAAGGKWKILDNRFQPKA